MAQANNPFSTLLNPPDTSAQLAILLPAADNDAPIRLTLTQAILRQTSYGVISYDRTDADDDKVPVSVDGEDRPVPRALESALRALRRREQPRTLWADLLLLGHEDTARLRHILSGAEETLCWLGPGSGEGASTTTGDVVVFETIAEMARRYSAACAQVGVDPDANLSRITAAQMTGLRERMDDGPFDDMRPFDLAHWREIYDVFGAPYWSSARRIAEIVLARSAVVARGRGGRLRWDAFVAASRALVFFHARLFQGIPLPPRAMRGFEIANEIEIADRRRRLGEPVELLPMIVTARHCSAGSGGGRGGGDGGDDDGGGKAENRDGEEENGGRRRGGRRGRGGRDPRENVFAVLPIVTPSARIHSHGAGPQPLPEVDYSKTTAQVFTEAARYCVLERQDLLLWYNERPPCARRPRRGLPSWVPDYAAMTPKDALLSLNNGMRTWWEALDDGPLKRQPIRVSADSSTLHVHARALDRVVYVSPIFDAANHRRLCFTEFQNLCSSPTLPGEGDRMERFWRTLALDDADTSGQGSETAAAAATPMTLSEAAGASFESLIAEETLLWALGCGTPEEICAPENAARLRANPQLAAVARLCGRGADYAALLAGRAAGRRFFRTAGGRFGMTAVEDVTRAEGFDGTCEEEEDEYDYDYEGEVGVGVGDSAGRGNKAAAPTSASASASVSASADGPQPPPPPPPSREPNLRHLMEDPIARGMMEGFQHFLQGRDPEKAQVMARLMRGEFPGTGRQQQQESRARGVQEGDIVVACVGGFFPYVLRPWPGRGGQTAGGRDNDGEDKGPCSTTTAGGGSSRSDDGDDDSTYEFVGECYLHGAMDGEDFKTAGPGGEVFVRIDTSELVEIAIV